jgi:hypothetical protein
MQKGKLIKLIILLFESKFKKYTEITLDSWYELMKDYPDEFLIRAIKQAIYNEDDFISVGKIHEDIKAKVLESNRGFNKELETLKQKKWSEHFNKNPNGTNFSQKAHKEAIEEMTKKGYIDFKDFGKY